MNEIQALKNRITDLERIVFHVIKGDRSYFDKPLEFSDMVNIRLSTGTGTKIGTATNQKLGFFNATPVDQAASIGAPTSPGALYNQATAQTAVDAINSLRNALSAANGGIGITA